MPVPLLDLTAQNLALESELKAAFERVLHSGQYILGREVREFEEALERFTGARHAIGVASGTDALLVALMAAGIGPGDDVLCPTFTFFATAGCVSRLGARPVFVDALPDTFNLDVTDAARRMTPATKAIIPVHLFGQAAAMDEVMELAEAHRLVVIEDTAQSLGATYRGRQLGTIGHVGTYSFFPSKNLGALGEAGLVVTNDDAIAERIRLLRVHGARPKYFHRIIGGNFRLDALQAALLSVKLPHYAAYTAARQRNAACYRARLSPLADTRLVVPTEAGGNLHIWNQYTLCLPGAGRRDALRAFCHARNIGTEIYYPVPLHAQECFRPLGYEPGDLPVAHRLADEVVSIPVFPEMTAAQQDEVIETITEFLNS
jgi:dTDP-4-amino-4,6-dideoxygalactose transaminase